MKALLLALALLTPHAARALPTPQILCDADITITFRSHWLLPGSVEIQGERHISLPWSGDEGFVTGTELHNLVGTDELAVLQGEENFLLFQGHDERGTNRLYVQRDLVRGAETDGIVLAQLPVPPPGTSPLYRVLHCRSR